MPLPPPVHPPTAASHRTTGTPRGVPDSTNAPPSIVLREVSFGYPGSPTVLDCISLRVERGELLGIIGPNGGGKSTLLCVMLGLLEPSEGRVEILGHPPGEARRRGLIGSVPQRSTAERSFPVNVHQAVSLGVSAAHPGVAKNRARLAERVEQALEMVGASDLARAPVSTLSGGQFQRVMIARALALEPEVLILDEPTAGVDLVGQRLFDDLIRQLHDEHGMTIVMVSQNVRGIASGAAHCDRVACLRGTLHFHAAPNGLTPQVLGEVFEHDLADVFGDVHVDAHSAADCPGQHAHVKRNTREENSAQRESRGDNG